MNNYRVTFVADMRRLDLFSLHMTFHSILQEIQAKIVLIIETMKDRKYWIRLNATIEHFKLPIDTWSIRDAAY
jgi:hypothetical protein